VATEAGIAAHLHSVQSVQDSNTRYAEGDQKEVTAAPGAALSDQYWAAAWAYQKWAAARVSPNWAAVRPYPSWEAALDVQRAARSSLDSVAARFSYLPYLPSQMPLGPYSVVAVTPPAVYAPSSVQLRLDGPKSARLAAAELNLAATELNLAAGQMWILMLIGPYHSYCRF
jgi:hypothetical protein